MYLGHVLQLRIRGSALSSLKWCLLEFCICIIASEVTRKESTPSFLKNEHSLPLDTQRTCALSFLFTI